MAVFMTTEEQEKVESLKRTNRLNWDLEQKRLEADAERKGEAFTPGVYEEVSDADALAAVRAGWRSELDRAFEKKFKREKVRGF